MNRYMRNLLVNIVVMMLIFAPTVAAMAADDIAKTNETTTAARASVCPQNMSGSQAAPCCRTAVCPQHERSQDKKVGRPITSFLSFGCKVNYGLTNWLLSDKCAIDRQP